MKKIIGILMTIVSIVFISSCSSTKSTNDFTTAKQASKLNINFATEKNGTLIVENTLNVPLVLFAGAISNNHVIGGINSLDTKTFDIFDDLPSDISKGTFLLRAVKESDYRTKGSNLDVRNDVIFGRVITYDRNQRSVMNITINNKTGGDGVVVFENDSNLVLEIRLDDPRGETIAVLSPLQRKTNVYLDPDPYGYTYFPVWRYYDKTNDTVKTITTTDLGQGRSAMPVTPGSGRDPQFVTFPNPDVNKLYAPVFHVRIHNETDEGILFRSGSTPQKTRDTGIGMINSGEYISGFEFMMLDAELEIGGLNFDLRKGADKVVEIPMCTYKQGHVYTITLRKDYTVSITETETETDLHLRSLTIPLVNES